MEKNVCVPFCNNLSVPLQIYCCNHYDYDAFLTSEVFIWALRPNKDVFEHKNQSINYGIFNIFFLLDAYLLPKG